MKDDDMPPNALIRFFSRAEKVKITPTKISKKRIDAAIMGIGVASLMSLCLSIGASYYLTQQGHDFFEQDTASHNLQHELQERGLTPELAKDQPKPVHLMNRRSLDAVKIALKYNHDAKGYDPVGQTEEMVRILTDDNATFYRGGKSLNYISAPVLRNETDGLAIFIGNDVSGGDITITKEALSDQQHTNLILLHELGHGLNSRSMDGLPRHLYGMRKEGFADIYMVQNARAEQIPEAGIQRFAMARTLSEFYPASKLSFLDTPRKGYNGEYLSWSSDHATAGAIWSAVYGEKDLSGKHLSQITAVQYSAQSQLAEKIDHHLKSQGGWSASKNKLAEIADIMLSLKKTGQLSDMRIETVSLQDVAERNIDNYVRSVSVLLPKVAAQMSQEIPEDLRHYVGEDVLTGMVEKPAPNEKSPYDATILKIKKERAELKKKAPEPTASILRQKPSPKV